MCQQVKNILLCRRLYNRKRQSGKPNALVVPLSDAENRTQRLHTL